MNNSGAFPLPVLIEEIDAAWLTAALRTRAPGVTVESLEIVDINRGTCTKIRLRLTMDEAGRKAGIPETVILKGGFEEHSRALSHVHLSEVRGYRDVFPAAPLPTPICYFADFDDERQQGIVIMEDLVARGVEFCSALRPHSFDQVARRLEVLARFHAKTWDSPGFQPGGCWDFIREGEPYLRDYMNLYLNPEEWQRFTASPRGAATSVRFHDLDLMIELFDNLVVLSQQVPHAIIHGDTHSNNLFIYPDGEPGFFDGLPGRGPVMKEVTYHLTCVLDVADRRRWEGALVQHYLDELGRNGVAAPSFDEAMRQFAAFLLDGHIIFMVNESFYQPEAINTAYTARFSAAMLDHDTVGVLRRVAV